MKKATSRIPSDLIRAALPEMMRSAHAAARAAVQSGQSSHYRAALSQALRAEWQKLRFEAAPAAAYERMSDAARVELVEKAVSRAASHLRARIDSPAKVEKLMRDDRDDIAQDAHLRLLSALEAGRVVGKNGERLNLRRIAARAANAAITAAWRNLYAHPTAAAEVETDEGETVNIIDLDADPTAPAAASPEAALISRAEIEEVVSRLPAAYQGDALTILKLSALYGYTYDDIATRLACSKRRVQRILDAIRACR